MQVTIAIIIVVFGLVSTALLTRNVPKTGCATINEKNACLVVGTTITVQKRPRTVVKLQGNAKNAGLPSIANGGKNVTTIFASQDTAMKNVLRETLRQDTDAEAESGYGWNAVDQKIV